MNRAGIIVLLGAGLLLLLTAGCCPMHTRHKAHCSNCDMSRHGHQPHHGPMMSKTAPAAQDARQDVLYSCACGPGCNCNTVSKTAGNCACGKPLAWGHMVKVEGTEALVCTCAEGCKCQQDAANPKMCACGKPLKRVDLQGSGMYFCNCGGSCKCNTVSAAPGECSCGMPLKQR